MENKPLVTQFRLSFFWIIIVSILATSATYVFAAILFYQSLDKNIQPANFYEKQIPELEAYIREQNTSLLLPAGEEGLKNRLQGDGLFYQVVDGGATILYGTNEEQLFSSREDLHQRINTTFSHRGSFFRVAPIINDRAEIKGAVVLAYRLNVSAVNSWGFWVIGILALALFSPFLYIILFTILFSRVLVKNINKPLNLLLGAAEKIKEKDLDFEINYRANNELGRLCRAFSEMKEGLESSLAAQWKMERERVEMVESLAHDLKAPLSLIRGYSEALMENEVGGGEKLFKYLSIVKENVDKSTALVEQLQYVADLENPGTQLELTFVNLQDFLKQKLQDYELEARQRDIKIGLKTFGKLQIPLRIDADKLGRILDNIVFNSLEYTPTKGEIIINVCASGGYVFYEISDSGKGFNQRDLDRAFDRFYRGDEARGSKGGHSGLGLYIAKQLAEQLGGSIKLGNNKSGGADITFNHKVF
ncbi:MAG: HAMP domain-containing sensor histidine kinase [Bacillota bacterium]